MSGVIELGDGTSKRGLVFSKRDSRHRFSRRSTYVDTAQGPGVQLKHQHIQQLRNATIASSTAITVTIATLSVVFMRAQIQGPSSAG